MKKISVLAMALVAIFASCEPICDSYEIGKGITAEELKAASSVTVVQENGVNVNRIKCNSTAATLTSWTNGVEVVNAAYGEFTMLLLGDQTVTVTALNPDGSTVSAEFPVKIDAYSPNFPVPPEWAIFCGSGAKDWTWDDDASAFGGNCWGNMGYQSGDPESVASGGGMWWGVPPSGVADQAGNYGFNRADGEGAVMTFQLAGTKIVKSSGAVGTFKFDMNSTNSANIGTLSTTGDGILFPCEINTGTSISKFEINRLNEQQLVLSESTNGAWGEATYWRFKAK